MSSSSHCTKMKFSITDFFSKYDQIRSFIFCAVSKSDMISKKLQNSDLKYYNVNLMADVFKIIVKYCPKIIAKYRYLSPSGNRALRLHS